MDDVSTANPQGLWQALVAAAVLGTDRAGKTPAIPQLIADAANEGDFLAQAAAVGVYARAGVTQSADATKLAKADSAPAPSFKGVESLRTILGESRSPLLGEWCQIAAQNRRVIPFALLPEMLRRAEKDRPLRRLLQPILGTRGLWLAQQNPAWRGLFVESIKDAENVWQTGTPEQRKQLLGILRSMDAQKARELVESTWAEDPPEDRAAFLEAFEAGLSPADEALLEGALDDKRKPVRDQAAELLARIPTSQFAHRMSTRLAALVEYTPPSKGLLRKKAGVLSVKLPGEPDAAGKRDGLVAKAREGMGAQAAMLSDIVAQAALSLWQQLHDKPRELIDAALAGEYAQALIRGWVTAAIRQKNLDWAEPLIRSILALQPAKQMELLPMTDVTPLLGVLPPQRAEGIAIDLLSEKNVRITEILHAMDFPWSPNLSRAAIRLIREAKLQTDHAIRYWLGESAGLRLHPSVADEAAKDWPDDPTPASKSAIDKFVTTLQFRRDMHKELAS
jgi:hypothetical protein